MKSCHYYATVRIFYRTKHQKSGQQLIFTFQNKMQNIIINIANKVPDNKKAPKTRGFLYVGVDGVEPPTLCL